MDFTYDAEQEALGDVARQAMDREVGGARLRQMADDPDGIDADLWTTLVDLGWTGLVIPEAFGGAGGGLSDLSIVLNETGRVPLPGPFFSSAVMATLAAKALGADSLLADLSTGRTVSVTPHEEALARARARQKDQGWRDDYRATRPKVERKIAHLMRRKHGGRSARVRGTKKVDDDFRLLAAAVNLARLAVLGAHSTSRKWAVAGA
jgi:hypothetical protein